LQAGKEVPAVPLLLIVEDDPQVRELMRERLKDEFGIITSGEANEALSLALQHKPDCILLDLSLPDFSGFELCQTFASLSSTRLTPVIVVTGRPAAEYREYCLNLGAADYFEKPVDFKRLRATLHSVLSIRMPERRSEVRVRLSVVVRIKGKDEDGKPFDIVTAADDVSRSAFMCNCQIPLKRDCVVDVFLRGGKTELPAGRARLVRTEHKDTPYQRHAFKFVDKPDNWVLQ
jgi:DNA-binding response OmpR family regulator